MKINKISRTSYTGNVYNFAVKDLENYIANGIVVHNCYKDNGLQNTYSVHLSLEYFKEILSRFDLRVLTQIAFGICDINSNKDMWDMFKHCRDQGIIPNYTCNGLGITKEIAKKTKELCGAVAVSIVNKEESYNAISAFSKAGLDQVNIHFMLSEETYEKAFELIDDAKKDPRLAGLRAIVFLQYKPKGNGKSHFHSVREPAKYKALLDYAFKNGVGIGFDSCSAPLFFRSAPESMHVYGEACESTLFSSYINVEGYFFPCSFMEHMGNWVDGLAVTDYDKFIDLWNDKKVQEWRTGLLATTKDCNCPSKRFCRSCPQYDLVGCNPKE